MTREHGARALAVQACAYRAPGTWIGPVCPALALPGSAFCVVHGRARPEHIAAPAPGVDRDADVLPWQRDDVTAFAAAAARLQREKQERQERQAQARRAALNRR